MTRLLSLLPALALAAGCATAGAPQGPAASSGTTPNASLPTMNLGAFSISLAVKDLAASRDFYQKLGFEKLGGDEAHNYLIMKNGDALVGLFQGMFEQNILTFNPGWGTSGQEVEPFTDARELERRLLDAGIVPVTRIPPEVAAGQGPASFVVVDPDGNPVLVDQHR